MSGLKIIETPRIIDSVEYTDKCGDTVSFHTDYDFLYVEIDSVAVEIAPEDVSKLIDALVELTQ